MPLPSKTLLVLPNPWAHVHPELGPCGVTYYDNGGRGGLLRPLGAEIKSEKTALRAEGDSRADRQVTWFEYPGLDDGLTKPRKDGAVEVPKNHYYLDRLRDGDLVPADDATRKASNARFANLEEAKKFGVADLEAQFGEGSWKELEQKLAPESKAELSLKKKADEDEKRRVEADAERARQAAASSGASSDGGKK